MSKKTTTKVQKSEIDRILESIGIVTVEENTEFADLKLGNHPCTMTRPDRDVGH